MLGSDRLFVKSSARPFLSRALYLTFSRRLVNAFFTIIALPFAGPAAIFLLAAGKPLRPQGPAALHPTLVDCTYQAGNSLSTRKDHVTEHT